METTRFEVAGSDGRPVRAVAHGPADAPTVLVAHGFKGFKDWGLFPWLCDELADAGLRAVRFDFSHNGVDAKDFDRLDLFLLDTATRHQEDLRAIAATVAGPFGLLGHSRGGGDVVLFAASEPRTACVATLAGVSSTDFAPPDAAAVLAEKGYYPFPNSRTKQIMPVGLPAFEDGLRHSIEAAARTLACPGLFIHGTADESVGIDAVRRYGAWVPNADVLEVDGAGHTFGAVHPWAGPTPALTLVVERLKAFFSHSLR